jgi:hypothetical protein
MEKIGEPSAEKIKRRGKEEILKEIAEIEKEIKEVGGESKLPREKQIYLKGLRYELQGLPKEKALRLANFERIREEEEKKGGKEFEIFKIEEQTLRNMLKGMGESDAFKLAVYEIQREKVKKINKLEYLPEIEKVIEELKRKWEKKEK